MHYHIRSVLILNLFGSSTSWTYFRSLNVSAVFTLEALNPCRLPLVERKKAHNMHRGLIRIQSFGNLMSRSTTVITAVCGCGYVWVC
jgi:hypothetical protein